MLVDQGLPFVEAFRLVQTNPDTRFMRLPHWKEDVEIHVQMPDDHSKMTHPYLYVKSRLSYCSNRDTTVQAQQTGSVACRLNLENILILHPLANSKYVCCYFLRILSKSLLPTSALISPSAWLAISSDE